MKKTAKKLKRMLACMLAVVMVLCAVPMSGFVGLELPALSQLFTTKAKAASEEYYTYTVTDGEATITDVDSSVSGDIVIPDRLGGYPVRSIGDSAFRGLDITDLTIPEGIRCISSSAFNSCGYITKINWNAENVSKYGVNVFSRAGMFTDGIDVVFGDSVKSIPENAFFGEEYEAAVGGYFDTSANIKSVTIGNNVTSIGSNAFYNCKGIADVTIPDSVISIGKDSFYGTAWDKALPFGEDIYIGKVYYKHNGPITNDTSIVIKEGTTCIAGAAFSGLYNYDGLTNVIIPNSVKSIGDSAFSGCGGLTSVIIPDSVINIGEEAFSWCDGLVSMTIPGSVTSIGGEAFRKCTSLTSVLIPGSVTNISYGVFYGCTSLASIMIPDGVISIDNFAFAYCSNLTDITVPNSLVYVDRYAFVDCINLKDVYYKGTKIQWDKISIHCDGNDSLVGATIHFDDSAHTHLYESTITTPATCVSDGVMTYTCSCGDSYTEEIPATGHSYVAEVTAPTCIKDGYTTHTCSVCGDTYTDSAVTALGHSFTNYVSDKNATCMADGTKTAKCDRCDVTNTITDEDSAKGHVESAWVTDKNSDCVNGGTKHTECTVCGQILQTATIPATGHSYVAEVTAPTCIKDGYTTHTCSVCGDTYTDSAVTALGHSFTNYVSDKNATCTADGTKTAKCDRCDVTNTITDEGSAKGHVESAWVTDKNSDCVNGGTKHTECTVCGQILQTETIPATGHNYVAEVTAPTCTKDGYTTHTCSVCGDTYTDSAVTALGHSFTNYVSDKNATCTADGTKTAKCDRCDVTNTVTDKGSKLAHTIVIDKAVEPTCSKSGLTEGQHCSVCGTVLVAQKTIPATGHNYVAEVTAPTCTKDGYTTHTCSVCGDTYTDSAVTALGHSFTNYVSDKNATCTADGTKTAKCDRCDVTNTVTDKGSKLAHTIVIDKAVEPTCSKSGLTEGQHCSVCGTVLVAQKTISATGHTDKNADGKCDDCGGSLDAVKNCTHLCHKTGFMGFIWKIVNFFNKLFRINKTCSCGMRHY